MCLYNCLTVPPSYPALQRAPCQAHLALPLPRDLMQQQRCTKGQYVRGWSPGLPSQTASKRRREGGAAGCRKLPRGAIKQ